MSMIEILGGLAVGCAVGYVAKDKLNPSTPSTQNSESEQLYAENEKLARRNKELECENEDLMADLQKIRRNVKYASGENEDMEDQLDAAKRELKSLCQQNDQLSAKVKEYKAACESLEAQLTMYKSK